MKVDIFSVNQKKALERLGGFLTQHDVYLGGTVAIGHQLGHRTSPDLEFFSPNELPHPEILALEIQTVEPSFEIIKYGTNSIHGRFVGVPLTIVEDTSPLIGKRVNGPGHSVIASLKDLGATTLKSIVSKGYRNDFLDLYELCLKEYTLDEVIEFHHKKYGRVKVSDLLDPLMNFKKADHQPLPNLLKKIDWPTVKKTVRKWVEMAAR